MGLEEKATSIRERAKVLRSVPGSGFHDNDPVSPQRRGLPAIDEHLVEFARKYDHVFTGDDCDKAREALSLFLTVNGGEDHGDLTTRAAIAAAKEVLDSEPTKEGYLAVPNSIWNAVLFAFEAAGVGITCTSAD